MNIAGDIIRLYYRYGTTSQDLGNTLGDIRIRLGQTTMTGFVQGNVYFTGLEMALHQETLVIPPGETGDWFPIDLDTPFSYDPTRTLIVDIMFATTTTLTFGTLGTSNDGRKLRSPDTTSTIGSSFPSTTWQDMGFDLEIGTGIIHVTNNGMRLIPNPIADRCQLVLDAPLDNDAVLEVVDISGRRVLEQRISASTHQLDIDLGGHSSGVYFIRILAPAAPLCTLRVLKE
jgi:hypothetical protein